MASRGTKPHVAPEASAEGDAGLDGAFSRASSQDTEEQKMKRRVFVGNIHPEVRARRTGVMRPAKNSEINSAGPRTARADVKPCHPHASNDLNLGFICDWCGTWRGCRAGFTAALTC